MKSTPPEPKDKMSRSVLTAKVDALLQLQENEKETAAIRVSLEALPDRQRLLGARLEEFETRIAQSKDRMSELQKACRQHEIEAQSIQGRIEKSNEKLKTVKTNKEYQAGLQEIEDLSQLQSGAEDKMLECLEAIDEAESAVASDQDRFEVFSRQMEEEKVQLEKESVEMHQKLQQLLDRHQQIVAAIDPKMLQKYEQTKQYTGATVVAAVRASVCQGCNMNIPPQMYNELQRFDRLLVCPHCERIIYPSGSLNGEPSVQS
jgi:predicted  nucleic acid-binding Zn-ribbon protein